MKIKAYNTMNELCDINPKYIVGHYTLPRRKVVNEVYISQYKTVMVNSDIYYIDCDVFDKYKETTL